MLGKSTKLHRLEFAVFRARPVELKSGSRVLAAVSGGADSVAMLQILSRIKVRWSIELEVAYVHHGNSKSEKLERYRNRAAKKVEAIGRSLGLPVHVLKIRASRVESEASLREGRFSALESLVANGKFDVIALGHHADDLFETRLIRLMRGTGPQGIGAMKPISETEMGTTLWRPLLGFRRREIEEYLSEIGLRKNRDWLEDPSNRDARYLRNAVRKKLIPLIEEIRPGAVLSMARSLELLSESIAKQSADMLVLASGLPPQELDRRRLLEMSVPRRREALAGWVDSLGIRDFSKAHIDEMLKRIDTRRKRLSFELCGRVWLVETTIRLAEGRAEALSQL